MAADSEKNSTMTPIHSQSNSLNRVTRSSAIVLRRDTGGMWAGAGVPDGNCDTRQVLCDSRERALPSWLAFN